MSVFTATIFTAYDRSGSRHEFNMRANSSSGMNRAMTAMQSAKNDTSMGSTDSKNGRWFEYFIIDAYATTCQSVCDKKKGGNAHHEVV